MYVYVYILRRFLQQLCVGACVLQFVGSNIFGILILLDSKVSKKGLPLKNKCSRSFSFLFYYTFLFCTHFCGKLIAKLLLFIIDVANIPHELNANKFQIK